MAFENVFRGIDFQAPNRAGRADQQMLMQAIGQGIGAYERGEEREIQKMQLEQKAQAARDKAGAFDLKKMGEQALYELNNGFEPTPERIAMAKAYSQSKSPVFNPISGELAPSPFQQAMGNTQAAFQGKPAQVQPVSTEQLGQPIAGGAAPSDPMQASKDAIAARQAQIGSNKYQRPELQIEPPTGASPKTQQAAQEANIDIKKQQAMNKISESKAEREFQLKKQRNRPAQERSLYGAAQEWGNIDNEINKAITQTSAWTAGAGSYLSSIGGTPAKNLQSTLDTITGDAAFTKLVQLKENGGTLGAISKSELDLLKASVKNLQADQSPDQLKSNLRGYAEIRKQSLSRISQAYKDEYGEVPEDITSMLGGSLVDKVDYNSKYGLKKK